MRTIYSCICEEKHTTSRFLSYFCFPHSLQIRAVDLHSFYVDPDPDPAVFFNADPDPGPGPAKPNLKRKKL